MTEQTKDENEAACVPSVLSAGLCVGGKVRLLTDIWDDGEDIHPPGWLGRKGEILIIRACTQSPRSNHISVSHEGVTDSSFRIFDHEYETHNVKVS